MKEGSITEQKSKGKTKSAGFQFGLRRTFPISVSRAWELITSEAALNIWLGKISGPKVEEGNAFTTAEGIVGRFRVVKPLSHLRVTWQPTYWKKASIVQIRIIPAANGGTTISFHQENLMGPEEREAMSLHWEEVLRRLEELIAGEKPS